MFRSLDAKEEQLRDEWQSAKPFSHVVIDDFVSAENLEALVAIVEDEPVETYRGDIFHFDATAPQPKTAGFRALQNELGDTYAPLFTRITGKPMRRADMRAYAYRPGHYLLPHTDHQSGVGRVIAYAYYLPSPEPPEDGALELFECKFEAGDARPDRAFIETKSARVIAPSPNRIVLFDVNDVSLHQVREVISGLRASLAGWFYAE